MIPQPRIISCDEWGARSPKNPLSVSSRLVDGSVLHHTAGLGGADKKQYARDTQNYHMNHNGWNDSGHSFLVCVDGTILEGRHGSIDAARAGKQMYVQAHCPGQNHNPGVEHEERNGPMTSKQFDASVALHAWLAQQFDIALDHLYRPHQQFYATACPGDLMAQIPALRAAVKTALAKANAPKKPRLPAWFWVWAQWRLGAGPYKGHALDPAWRPLSAPETIPGWAWDRLKLFGK